ncbi:MAG TPA: PilZ domain-containing protein [Myxococcaceae bacterium]|nr:PilZ domain-containing protein [Myxococcaceae bacterium]
MPSKTNSRKNARVACGVPARAEGPRGPLRGQCTSLSRAGMFFTGPTIPIGTSVELAVDLPGYGFHAVGEVRYHVNRPGSAGMGIRFTRLAQEDLQAIGDFIQRTAA